METKIIVFKHNRGKNDVIVEEIEFDVDATEEVINEEYIDWIIEQVGDSFTWYEKE